VRSAVEVLNASTIANVTRAKKLPRAGMCFLGHSLCLSVNQGVGRRNRCTRTHILINSHHKTKSNSRPSGAHTCALSLFCDRDLEINSVTLKLEGDLDIPKMYLHTENEAASLGHWVEKMCLKVKDEGQSVKCFEFNTLCFISALEVFFKNDMRYINSRFTYLLTYLLIDQASTVSDR